MNYFQEINSNTANTAEQYGRVYEAAGDLQKLENPVSPCRKKEKKKKRKKGEVTTSCRCK